LGSIQMEEEGTDPGRTLHPTGLGLEKLRLGAVLGLAPVQPGLGFSSFPQNVVRQFLCEGQVALVAGLRRQRKEEVPNSGITATLAHVVPVPLRPDARYSLTPESRRPPQDPVLPFQISRYLGQLLKEPGRAHGTVTWWKTMHPSS